MSFACDCIKEAARLFENGGYQNCDVNILVTAPVSVRIQRILERDQTTLEAIQARMEHQWPDEEKIPLADYVIENTDLDSTQKQVEKIHARLC